MDINEIPKKRDVEAMTNPKTQVSAEEFNSIVDTVKKSVVNKLGTTTRNGELYITHKLAGGTDVLETQLPKATASTPGIMSKDDKDKLDKLSPNYPLVSQAINGNSYNVATDETESLTIYAPTEAGSEGYILASTGSGAPNWIPQADIKSGDADHARNADNAIKASQDSAGNVIRQTYATKADVDKIVQEKVDVALADTIESDQETIAQLREASDWLKGDESGAESLANQVSANKAGVEGIQTQLDQELYLNAAVELTLNEYYNGNGYNPGDTYPGSSSYVAGLACAKIAVKKGDRFVYKGTGSAYVRHYIIVDSNNVITRMSSSTVGSLTEEIVIEEGESIMYSSFNNYNPAEDYLMAKSALSSQILINTKAIGVLGANQESLIEDVNLVKDSVNKIEGSTQHRLPLSLNRYYNGNGVQIGDTYNPTTNYLEGGACVKLSVKEGDSYVYCGGGSSYVRAYIVTDANNVVTQISSSNVYRTTPLEIKIQGGDAFLYCSFNAYDASTDYLHQRVDIIEELDSVKKVAERAEYNSSVLYETLSEEIILFPAHYYRGYEFSIGEVYNEDLAVLENGACIKVKVQKGEHYRYNGKISTYVLPYIITDSNGVITRIKKVNSFDEWGQFYTEIEIEEGESFLYCSFNTYDPASDYLKVIKPVSSSNAKSLYGKNIVCFGDSITEFSSSGKRVTDYLAELSGANVTNVAFGGTRLSQRHNPIPNEPSNEWTAYAAHDLTALVSAIVSEDYSTLENAANWLKDNAGDDNTAIVDRLKNINWNNVDAVTILIGTNDYAGGTGLGATGGENVELIRGAINYIVKSLLTKYPHLTIYWFTPVPRWMATTLEDRTDSNWAGNKENSNGNTLLNYVDAIIEQCRVQGVPVCDTYRTIGWTKYNLGEYLSSSGTDGVHPYRGFEQIAKKMLSFIESNNVL